MHTISPRFNVTYAATFTFDMSLCYKDEDTLARISVDSAVPMDTLIWLQLCLRGDSSRFVRHYLDH